MSRAVRRRLRTGVTVASAGIVAAGLVPLPPKHDATLTEFQAVRLTAFAVTAPAVTSAALGALRTNSVRISLSAAAVAASTASDGSSSPIRQKIGAVLGALAFVGLIVVGGLALLPFTILYQVQQVVGKLFGRQTAATSAANSAAAVAPGAKASGRKARTSGHAIAPTATALVAPSVAAATGGPAHRSTRATVSRPVERRVLAQTGKSNRGAANAATATARKSRHSGVGSESAAAK